MKDSWLCRDYQSGDEYQILSLYEEVNNRNMALEYWRWRHAKSPFGKGIIKLVLADGKLIGHYAVTPMDILVDNRPLRAVFSLHTMTHPAFQRQGIFTFLAEEVYKRCQSESFSFAYGFPNENSYHGFTNKLGWTGFGKMSSLEKKLDAKTKAVSKAGNIHEIDRFDDRVNVLWDTVKAGYRVIVPRTKDYLNWRFAEHPTVEYPRYIITSGGSELSGYMVLKVYRNGDLVKGHIVDMLSVDDEHTVKGLLNTAHDYFIERGIENLSCWMPESCFCTRILKQEGFINKEFDVNFGVRIFEKADKSLRSVEQLDNWHLTMSDVDVF
jgi:GNAT superfamily N-acetyltransferase